MSAIDFQSPSRKRKVPMTSSKMTRNVIDSPVDSKLFYDNSSHDLIGKEDAATTGDRTESYVFREQASPAHSTAPRKYATATDSEGNCTKAVYSPADHAFIPSHLLFSFPPSVSDSPYDTRVVYPSRAVAMPNEQDSSLSSISHNNSALLNSPPRYLFDSNGTGVDADTHTSFIDHSEKTSRLHSMSSPTSDMQIRSFDEVQSPEVGTISMCASPQLSSKRAMDSPSLLITLSPSLLRNSPSPRPLHFSCVRAFGDTSRTSSYPSSLTMNNSKSPEGGPARPAPITAVRGLHPKEKSDTWHNDSSGVASRLSTLNVNKHDYDSFCDDAIGEEGGSHKCRRVQSDAGEECCARATSPISSHTSFMDLLDAAVETPGASHARSSSGPSAKEGAALPPSSKWAESGPTFRFSAQPQGKSPFHSSSRTPKTSHRNVHGAINKTTSPISFQFQSPLPSPMPPPLGLVTPAVRSLSPPPRAGHRSPEQLPAGPDRSPPGSYVSVKSYRTDTTDDDQAFSPPRKLGSNRSILSDFGLRYGPGNENLFLRSNSNSSIASGHSTSLPLPDQSAFDQSVVKPRKSHGGRGAPSPVCPPTPDRSNLYWGSAHVSSIGAMEMDESGHQYSDDEDGAFLGQHGHGYPLQRQKSLDMNKLLLEGTVELDPSGDKDVVFDRDFVNLGILGSGSFAVVYVVQRRDKSAAEHSDEPPRYYAVKKNKKKFRGHGDREALLNEVRMMKLAGTTYCPHIVHLIRSWQEDGFFYVEMDIAEKGSVRELIVNMADSGRHFPNDTIWRMIYDTLQGLKHLHSYDVIHLDIKPANLLISRTGRIMIGDFGLAAHIGDDSEGNEGDARYMAPELLNFTERSTAADMFSLGLTFFEVCVVPTSLANLPVSGNLWLDFREGRVPSIDTEHAARTAAMKELLLACLVPNPTHRASAVQLLSLPELSSMDSVIRHEAEGTKDPILSSIPTLSYQQTSMSRSSSFPTNMNNPLSRPLSFALYQDTLQPLNIEATEAALRSDLTTPTHIDGAMLPNTVFTSLRMRNQKF